MHLVYYYYKKIRIQSKTDFLCFIISIKKVNAKSFLAVKYMIQLYTKNVSITLCLQYTIEIVNI